jgi:nicotinate-nucleotide adenylyltransferase
VLRILIFGGTFNPPHEGHVALAAEALRALQPDKLLIIPAYVPPHKEAPGVTFEHRFAMCERAFAGIKKAEISDIERQLGGANNAKSYTIDTLRALKRKYPGNTKFFLLIGSDMLFCFDQWYKYSSILNECSVVAAAREEDCYSDMLEQANRLGHVKILNIPVKRMNSTAIRGRVFYGGETAGLLNDAVRQYVSEQELYKILPPPDLILSDDNKRYTALAREKLSAKRFYHSRCVADECVKLAKQNGVDENRAYTAGILHDICKEDDPERLLEAVKQSGFEVDEVERREKKLWHTVAGAVFARDELKITDTEIISAMRHHSTGKPAMTTLELIVYLSDWTGLDREHDYTPKFRELAEENLEHAAGVIMAFNLDYLRSKGKEISALEQAATEYYVNKMKETR